MLRAADIARQPTGSIDGIRRVAGDTLIDGLLGYLAEHPEGLVVEDSNGKVLGLATASAVLSALAAGSSNEIAAGE